MLVKKIVTHRKGLSKFRKWAKTKLYDRDRDCPVKTVGSWDWEKILAGIAGLKTPIRDPLTGQEEEKARKPGTSDRLFVIGRNVFCLIRCIYIHFTAPLTIYPGRSFPRHERCLSVTCSFFWPFLPSFFQRRILGCVRSNNFESSPYRSSFVIRCYFPLLEYRESGHIEAVASYLFCQA